MLPCVNRISSFGETRIQLKGWRPLERARWAILMDSRMKLRCFSFEGGSGRRGNSGFDIAERVLLGFGVDGGLWAYRPDFPLLSMSMRTVTVARGFDDDPISNLKSHRQNKIQKYRNDTSD
jgi:hypothetical protein